MTDYEMLSGLTELINTLWTIFTVYVSIVFAVLVAGYIAAAKLTSRMVSLIITLYTLVALWALLGLNRTSLTITALTAEIQRAVLEEGSSLGWHPVTTTPDFVFVALPFGISVLAIVAYVGSIIFFLHQRRSGSPA